MYQVIHSLNSSPWNAASFFLFCPAKSPQSPQHPHQKRPFSHLPPPLMRHGSHIIAWSIWLCAEKDRQTHRWADRLSFLFLFFSILPPRDFLALLFKKLILFHSPLIKSQRIPRVYCLLKQHPALDLAFSFSEGSDDVFSHVWCLAFRITSSFSFALKNPADVNSSPERVGFEVGEKN